MNLNLKNKKHTHLKSYVSVLLLMSLCHSAFAALSEEEKLIQISKKLKPIPDAQWSEIIGAHHSDAYEIQKGDTLWDISMRLFGNAKYWPKVWALNSAITNPHIIRPGKQLIFSPGSAESLPSLALESDSDTDTDHSEIADVSDHPKIENPGRIKEYDRVSQDYWKPITVEKKVSMQYDEFGLEKEVRIKPLTYDQIKIPAIANDSTIPYLGTITGSSRDGAGLSTGDTVFIKSEGQDLQVGTTYSVLSDPEFSSEEKSDRTGYIYSSEGEVKIIGIKDEAYVGLITKSSDVVQRGDHLYPLLPVIREIKPVAANEAVEALMFINPKINLWNTAQYHFVHFDRGLEDGVQVGNVFRIYEYFDPITQEKITNNDVLVKAEAIVVHTTAQFCTALILRSRTEIERNDFGVLLTDVSALEKKDKDRSKDFSAPPTKEDSELDELDTLDRIHTEGLGEKEKQEVQQLEDWDKTNELDNSQDTDSQEPGTESTDQQPADQQIDQSTSEPTIDENPVTEAPQTTTAPETSPNDTVTEPPSHSDDAELDSGTDQAPSADPVEPDAEAITP